MNQTVDTDRYIEMVKALGIEEAYKQRYRCTGRTVRDVLKLALKLSEGDKIVIITYGTAGNTFDTASQVLNRVRYVFDSLGGQFKQVSRTLLKTHIMTEKLSFVEILTACEDLGIRSINCMIVNGIDLSGLTPQLKAQNFPETVPGRVVHIDADFLAYQASYERKDEEKTFDDMKHNLAVAIEMMRKQAAAESIHLHLTPSTSDKGGRYDIAIQKEYQSNRKDKPKPRYLHILREYMGHNFPATLHKFCEADDGMSSSQYKALAENARSKSIICSKDKDLNMVPGLHMDWDSGDIIDTDSDFGYIVLDESKSSPKITGYGQKFLWAQMLMGDSADTIQGLPFAWHPSMTKPKKVGPVLAFSLLTDINSNKEAFQYIKSLYQAAETHTPFKHWLTGETVSWQQVFVSELKLLWMRRDIHNPNCVLQWLKEINV